ncbi:hypothetical protein [Adhaeribacter aquaticus]|uniref:hypothetical protein n=1 Tax=Adhaeribacter aquaticus TaxID=299567 RepID=UPI00040896D2|nr:hypothetical protein [Adhaeribacter aquaticus]
METAKSILLHTQEEFIVHVTNQELESKFLASPYFDVSNPLQLQNLVTFIEEVMRCQVPEKSLADLEQLLTKSNKTQKITAS